MSQESDRELLIRIDQNVTNTMKTLDGHISDDKRIHSDFLLPMWNEYQQGKGAARQRGAGGAVAGWVINAGIACVAAWAAVKTGVMKP